MTWQIHFYNNKRKCFKRINHDEHFTRGLIFSHRDIRSYYEGTPKEYLITALTEIATFKFNSLNPPLINYSPSYFEVFIGTHFCVRHYVRGYTIAPHIWLGAGEDPWINKRLIATSPTRNIVMDVFWGRIKRRTPDEIIKGVEAALDNVERDNVDK